MTQMQLLPKIELRAIKAKTFGGCSFKKRRKIARPLQPGLIHHVVFKSSKAKGNLSFYSHKKLVSSLLKERSRKYFIDIKDFVNMGNHLHLKIKFKRRKDFQNFIRTFAAILALKITGANRTKKFGKFWDGLTFTRILTSKFEELGLKGYFEGNHRQRELGYSQREFYLKRFNEFLYRLKAKRAKNGAENSA